MSETYAVQRLTVAFGPFRRILQRKQMSAFRLTADAPMKA
jgi:hypothetical protein